MANQPGVYICSGCSIGQSLDIGKLVKVATGGAVHETWHIRNLYPCMA